MVNSKTKEITLTALFSEALPVNQSLIEKLWANQNTYSCWEGMWIVTNTSENNWGLQSKVKHEQVACPRIPPLGLYPSV